MLDCGGMGVKPLDLGFADVAIGGQGHRDSACCGLRAVHGIAAHGKSRSVADGLGSVEDVAQPGLLAVALLASAVLEVRIRELWL